MLTSCLLLCTVSGRYRLHLLATPLVQYTHLATRQADTITSTTLNPMINVSHFCLAVFFSVIYYFLWCYIMLCHVYNSSKGIHGPRGLLSHSRPSELHWGGPLVHCGSSQHVCAPQHLQPTPAPTSALPAGREGGREGRRSGVVQG